MNLKELKCNENPESIDCDLQKLKKAANPKICSLLFLFKLCCVGVPERIYNLYLSIIKAFKNIVYQYCITLFFVFKFLSF
jgi:hypothetical protein